MRNGAENLFVDGSCFTEAEADRGAARRLVCWGGERSKKFWAMLPVPGNAMKENSRRPNKARPPVNMLTLAQVIKMTGVRSRNTITKYIGEKRFPAPRRAPGQPRGWRRWDAEEVAAWKEGRWHWADHVEG